MAKPNKSGAVRKLVMLVGLIGTIFLSLPDEDLDSGVVEAADVPSGRSAERAASLRPDDARRNAQGPAETVLLPADHDDPFAIRQWQPPPVAAPVQAPVVASPQAAAPPPSGPPPLPYKYMGRMLDDGAEVVYLARGDDSVIARLNDTLQSTYRVVAISQQALELEHLPTGERQTLTVTPVSN
jgi:hypothetical protein